MMPNREQNLLQHLQQQLQQLNRSERKVADIIVADPQRATGMSIASLAKAAGVSEPTVNRLCRKLGVKGYPDFKIQLARSHATGIPYVSVSVAPNDGVEQYTNKIFSSSIASLDAARKAVDPTAIGEAVDYLSQAQQIYFFGMGASGAVAKDAQHKFFRFNIPVSSHDDFLMQGWWHQPVAEGMLWSCCHLPAVLERL